MSAYIVPCGTTFFLYLNTDVLNQIVPCGTINIQVYKNLQNLFRYTKYKNLQKYLQCQIINIQNGLQNYLLL